MKTLDLFGKGSTGDIRDSAPLAERMRPQKFPTSSASGICWEMIVCSNVLSKKINFFP